MYRNLFRSCHASKMAVFEPFHLMDVLASLYIESLRRLCLTVAIDPMIYIRFSVCAAKWQKQFFKDQDKQVT